MTSAAVDRNVIPTGWMHPIAGRTLVRTRRYLISTLLALALSAMMIPVDRAVAYDPAAAARYANGWWNSCNDVQYPRFGNDCTNYVSQAVHAGGYSMHYKGSSNPWYYYFDGFWGWSNSSSWSVVSDYRTFLRRDIPGGWVVSNEYGRQTASSQGVAGDVVFYAWYNDRTFNTNSHASIVVATAGSATHGGAYGNLVDAHTNSRYREYWTLYYYNSL